MQGKNEFLKEEENPVSQQPVVQKMGQYLSTADLSMFARTSKTNWAITQPLLEHRKFLHHVMRSEYDAVQKMLETNINLIFTRRTTVATDCSGRTFEKISGFEYALWAKDSHMWKRMLRGIPQNKKGQEIIKELHSQYQQVETQGITYTRDSARFTEPHFDFKMTIIKELQAQVKAWYAPGNKNWDAIHDQWKKRIGNAQKLLPMHAIDAYCSYKSFYPIPEFTLIPETPLSRQFYNVSTNKLENWFDTDSKLGIDFAIYKIMGAARAQITSVGYGLALDLDAMQALYASRTKEFIKLKSQLETQIAWKPQPQGPRI